MLGGILALAAAATFGLNSVAIRRGVLSGTVAQGLAISIPIGMPILLVAALVSGSFGFLGPRGHQCQCRVCVCVCVMAMVWACLRRWS